MIKSDNKTPPTYDYPGQATPGYKTKDKPQSLPTPAAIPTPSRTSNKPMNYYREDDHK